MKNALFQLGNAFGKTLKTLRALRVSCTKKERTVSNQAYRQCFEHKERIGQWILGTQPNTMKKEDRFFVL